MPQIVTETVTLSAPDGTALPAYVARPAETPKAGLIVFQEVFGVNAHIRDVTRRFAREGYLAVAPALFHRTDPQFETGYADFSVVQPHRQALTEEGLTADAQASFDWLTGEGIAAVGAVGYCLGGRTAYLANAALPLACAVSYYGAGMNLAKAADQRGPLLLFWGGKDANLGPEYVRSVEDALRAAGKAYTQVIFSEAEHGFFCDARAACHPEAARQAWGLILDFLRGRLTAPKG